MQLEASHGLSGDVDLGRVAAGSVVKSPPAIAGHAGDAGLTRWLGRGPGGGNGTPPVLWPGKSQGQRSLEGFGPGGLKESDTTEHAHKQT